MGHEAIVHHILIPYVSTMHTICKLYATKCRTIKMHGLWDVWHAFRSPEFALLLCVYTRSDIIGLLFAITHTCGANRLGLVAADGRIFATHYVNKYLVESRRWTMANSEGITKGFVGSWACWEMITQPVRRVAFNSEPFVLDNFAYTMFDNSTLRLFGWQLRSVEGLHYSDHG